LGCVGGGPREEGLVWIWVRGRVNGEGEIGDDRVKIEQGRRRRSSSRVRKTSVPSDIEEDNVLPTRHAKRAPSMSQLHTPHILPNL
jgi:hypothetical protein